MIGFVKKHWSKDGRARMTPKSQLVRDIRGAATVSKRKGLKVSLSVLKWHPPKAGEVS
jgi:hypothetical protein